MKDTNELLNGLGNFTGTEMWWHHWLNKSLMYTDGVRFFAQNAGNGAYWLLDIIATEVFPLLKTEPFIVIELQVESSDVARIVASDGNDRTIWAKGLDYTDCPVGLWKFYLLDDVLLLPSEY